MELLMEDYLTPSREEYEVIKKFADIIRQYDTWLWKTKYNNEIPKEWNDLFYILGRERFIDNMINKIQSMTLSLYESEKLLLALEKEKIDRYIESKNNQLIKKELFFRCKVGIVFGEQYHSELGNRLCEMNPDLDFVAIINPSHSVSYRSIGDKVDLGKDIAKIYGGGGHMNSAGSQIGDEIRHQIIDMIFKM